MLEDQAEMGDGLAVSTGPGRVPRGGRAVGGDGFHVVGLRRVMDDLRHVAAAPGHQCGEDAAGSAPSAAPLARPRRWRAG